MRLVVAIALSTICLAGCASITKGTDQNVVVNTNPQGARCELVREGDVLAVVDPTPGTIVLDKSKNDIQIGCELDGYTTAQYVLESESEGMTLGNLAFGGLIGLGVDAATGAMNKYDSNVMVVMQRDEAALAGAPLTN